MRCFAVLLAALFMAIGPGCGSSNGKVDASIGHADTAGNADAASHADTAGSADTSSGVDSAGSDAPVLSDAVAAGDSGGVDSGSTAMPSCTTKPPPGATLAPPPPAYSGGTCPQLKVGTNTIMSKGVTRQFTVVVPANPKPNEKFPVVFLWYWLKGTAAKMAKEAEVQQAADQQRFIGVLPVGKGDLKLLGLTDLPWPVTLEANSSRRNEEFVYFDDMLACVSKQFNVNKECVSSLGISAGALFTAQLAAHRGQYLSSFVSLSGGVAGGGTGLLNNILLPWKAPSHPLPALVLWGGPLDICVLNDFNGSSLSLEKKLTAGGHFFVECIHNCKHTQPPFVLAPPKTKLWLMWDFILHHPYWLKAGQSPFLNGLPAGSPSWCAVGMNKATPRTGACTETGCTL